MNATFRPACRPLATVVLALLLSACGSPVNQENFDRIRNGMTQQDVEAILGGPTESSSASFGGLSGGAATWKSRDATITVQFVNGEVQFKQFQRGAQDD